MKSSKVLIEHQCPQCGAPATLEETDHLFTCEFCRVKSFLLSGDFFRYLLPDRAPADRELFYVPYWRFKGLLFSCVPQGIKHRIMDVSFPALNTPCFPVSLGLRSQVLKLRFASTEAGGRFLKPDISLHEAKGILEERFSAGLPKVIFEQSFVGEAISQIYSPFFMDGRIHDGVLNRALKTRVDPDFDPDRIPGGSAEWPIRFIPALCPDCGWDLQGERDSLALACRNCNALWLGGKTRFVRMKYGRMPSSGNIGAYLPFYRIHCEVSGIELESYADLVRIANLPKVIQPDWEKRAFCFWAPAFKVNPFNFLSFSRKLTLTQPRRDWEEELPREALHPVTLPIQEAVESLKITLASFMKPQEVLCPRLGEIHIRPKSFLLVYIPFQEEKHELYQPALRLTINRTLLGYANRL